MVDLAIGAGANSKQETWDRFCSTVDRFWPNRPPGPGQRALEFLLSVICLIQAKVFPEDVLTETVKGATRNAGGYLRTILLTRLCEDERAAETADEAKDLLRKLLGAVRERVLTCCADRREECNRLEHEPSSPKGAEVEPPRRTLREATAAERADGHTTAQAVLESLRNAKKLRDANKLTTDHFV